jgi:TATA-binding protein-associated factor Taf7
VIRFTSVHRKRFTSSIRFRHTEVRNTKIVDIGEETQEESSEEEMEGDRESNEGNMDCNEPLQIEAAESVNLIPIKKRRKDLSRNQNPLNLKTAGNTFPLVWKAH